MESNEAFEDAVSIESLIGCGIHAASPDGSSRERESAVPMTGLDRPAADTPCPGDWIGEGGDTAMTVSAGVDMSETRVPAACEVPHEPGDDRGKIMTVGFMTIAVYHVTRECGGAEEGGWWYDRGVLAEDAEFLAMGAVLHGADREDAEAARADVQALLDRDHNVSTGMRDISASISGGGYRAQIHDGWPPRSFPEGRQTYS